MAICGSCALYVRVATIWWTAPLALFLSLWENTHCWNDRFLMLSRVASDQSVFYIELACHDGTLEWVPTLQSLIYHFSHLAFRFSPTLITVSMLPVNMNVKAESTAAALRHRLCLHQHTGAGAEQPSRHPHVACLWMCVCFHWEGTNGVSEPLLLSLSPGWEH